MSPEVLISDIESFGSLTNENVADMIQFIQYGRYCEDRLQANDFDKTEELKLTIRAYQGREATDIAFGHFKNLVPYLLKNVFSLREDLHYFQDCLQAGYIGILAGISKADTSKFRPEAPLSSLTSYVREYITAYVHRELNAISTTIRLPMSVSHQVLHLIRRETLEADPFSSHEDYDYHTEKIGDLKSTKKARAISQTLPLDTNRGFGTDREFTNEEGRPNLKADFIDDLIDENVDVEAEVVRNVMGDELLEDIRDLLNPRELAIIRMRFGLFDSEIMTYEEIGNFFGLTRERIRQIEAKAIVTLRTNLRSKYDEGYNYRWGYLYD